MVPSFWDSTGLKLIAQLVASEAEKSSQKEIARRSGLSDQTISNLLLNRHNAEGRIIKPPQPDTLLQIAPHITDPRSKKPFDPEDFLLVARGRLNPFPEPCPVATSEHPYPAAVQELRRLMGDRSIEQAAQDWGISPARLHGFLTATDERAVPNILEVQAIVAACYPDKLINRFYQFYEEPQTVRRVPGKRKR